MFLGLQPSAQSLGFEQALQALISAFLCLRCFLSRGGVGEWVPAPAVLQPVDEVCSRVPVLFGDQHPGILISLEPLEAHCPGKDRALDAVPVESVPVPEPEVAQPTWHMDTFRRSQYDMVIVTWLT